MWLILVASLSHAQVPGLSFGPTGEPRWVVADVEAKRFAEGDEAGPALKAGDEVELVFTEGDRVRIKKGDRYGWIAASAVTEEAPEIEISTDNPLLSNPLLTTPAMGQQPPSLGAGMGAGSK